MIVVPSAFTATTGKAHWEPLMREDLGEVSRKLGLEAPAAYRGVIHALRRATA